MYVGKEGTRSLMLTKSVCVTCVQDMMYSMSSINNIERSNSDISNPIKRPRTSSTVQEKPVKTRLRSLDTFRGCVRACVFTFLPHTGLDAAVKALFNTSEI